MPLERDLNIPFSFDASPKLAIDARMRTLLDKARKRIKSNARKEVSKVFKRLGVVDGSKRIDDSRKSGVVGARPGSPRSIPPLSPTSRVRYRLPSGRIAQVLSSPAPARYHDVAALRSVTGSNVKTAFKAIDHNGRAIDALVSSQKELAKKLAKIETQGDLALMQAFVKGVSQLEGLINKTRREQAKALAVHKRSFKALAASQQRALRTELKMQKKTAQIQKLNDTAASIQSAAFGTKGDLLATNNLLLAANQLLWGFSGELFNAFGLSSSQTTSALAWLAPLANLALGQTVLGRRQHVRFVSGIAERFEFIDTGEGKENSRFVARVSLRDYIAKAQWSSFRSRKGVPVTVIIIEPRDFLKTNKDVTTDGRVDEGVLVITVIGFSKSENLKVAWTVDTQNE